MKRVLIISPYFPPTNAADMQRVRMSLPYFKEFGWEAEVVTVDLQYTDMNVDPILKQSVSPDVPVHYVKALSKKWTSKIGLGSVSIRSLLYFKGKVNRLLKEKQFDLVYFSTTQFHVCILGSYWKKRFGVPYVIDMQDPWHSDYYLNKPKNERPPKYWFSYRLNKTLEPIAMKQVQGLISVSDGYLKTLSERYPHCRNISQRTIPFGAFRDDFDIARRNSQTQPSVLANQDGKINVVYIGRGGSDMQDAVSYLFQAFRECLTGDPARYSIFHFYFIGTSYAAKGQGKPSFAPLAAQYDLSGYVTEITDRLPFYQTLNTLDKASALFVPGSNDAQYTASKIYPYVLVQKPLLALFHQESSVVTFLDRCGVGTVVTFDEGSTEIIDKIQNFLRLLSEGANFRIEPDEKAVEEFSARTMTKHQCDLFDSVVHLRN